MKELYIHIGQAKTGTSMIQAFLALNRDLLNKKGLYYPLFREELVVRDKNCAMNGNAYGMWELDRPFDQMSKEQIEYMRQINTWFRENDRVLISEEGLWVCSAAFYKNCLSLLDERTEFRLKIIVYLRRQDQRLESLWNQCVKAGTYSRSCMEFCEDRSGAEQDYYSQLKMIADVIGKENMIVKVYDSGCFSVGNDLLEDFMSVFGFEDLSEFQIPKYQVNPSFGKDMIEIAQVTNTIPDIQILDNEFRKIKKELTQFRQSADTVMHAPSFLTYEERKRILDKCSEGNRKIGQEYFGIEKSPFPDLEQSDKNMSGGGISKELVYFLFSLIVKQAKEIETLHWQTDDFELSKKIEESSAVIVYGADQKGRRVYHWLEKKGNYQIAGFVDKRWEKLKEIEKDLRKPESIFEKEFDYILISMEPQDAAQQVEKWLKMRGVAAEKIVRVL